MCSAPSGNLSEAGTSHADETQTREPAAGSGMTIAAAAHTVHHWPAFAGVDPFECCIPHTWQCMDWLERHRAVAGGARSR